MADLDSFDQNTYMLGNTGDRIGRQYGPKQKRNTTGRSESD
jgi:hypothetical protein